MKKFIIYAERTISEVLEIEAETLEQAHELACEADNSEWHTAEDISWEVVGGEEAKE